MSTRRFSSFEEIDIELEILQVERKLSLYRIRSTAEHAVGGTVHNGFQFALKPLLRTLLVTIAIRAVKRRLFGRH